MSGISNAKSYKGTGKGNPCDRQVALNHCGAATWRQIDAVCLRLIKEHPDWKVARCAQRARVEVYLRGAV